MHDGHRKVPESVPKATLFDEELFRLGWEAGAKYGLGSSCSGGMEEKSCNPPESNMIRDSHDDWGRV
jgi:hypothetical protein